MYVILMGKARHRTPGGLEEPLQEKEGGHQIVELCCLFCCADCLLCYFCLQRNWNYGSNLGLRKSHRSEFYDCGFRVLMSLPVICVLMPPTIFFSHKQMWEPDQMNMEIRDEGAKLTAVLRSWLAPSWLPHSVSSISSQGSHWLWLPSRFCWAGVMWVSPSLSLPVPSTWYLSTLGNLVQSYLTHLCPSTANPTCHHCLHSQGSDFNS